MTRTTITSGTAGSAPDSDGKLKPKARKREAGNDAKADAGDDSVLEQQFTREFQAILRQIKETQGSCAGYNADGDAQAERSQIAHYGVISQRLVVLVHRLLHRTDELAACKKENLLLIFGDKFMEVHEYQAAQQSFYKQIVQIWHDSERRDIVKTKNDVYVRAMYGSAMCQFRIAQRGDPYVRFPGTLEKLVASLALLQQGMETSIQLERSSPHQYAWLLLNGSILVYSIARPLQTLGFEREVVAYLKWCLLCLESTVMLSTTKYILWRLQLYTAVCECLESLAIKRPKKASVHLQSLTACANHALQMVTRLRKEEELDLPLPNPVVTTLSKAETIAKMLVARSASLAKGEFFGRKAIESMPLSSDRLRLVVDALDKTRPQDGNTDAAVSDLFSLAMELVQPLLAPLVVDVADDQAPENTQGALRTLERQLPLMFHMILLRHAYQLHRMSEMEVLLQAARRRSTSFASTRMELDLYDALWNLDKPIVDEMESSYALAGEPRKRLEIVGKALRAFVTCSTESINVSMRDLLRSVALRLWRDGAVTIIRELDGSPKPENGHHVQVGVSLLDATYTTLRAIDFDDLVLLGEICLRLCLLLHVQENRRNAIRIARDYLSIVDAFRDRVADSKNHFGSLTNAMQQSIASGTFSFDIDVKYAKSDCETQDDGNASSSRQRVGVEGSGSQFGALHQELTCLQVDVLLLLFKLELEEAAAIESIELENTAVSPAGPLVVSRPSVTTVMESALHKEFKKNAYVRVLLNTQCIRRATDQSTKDSVELVTECFKLLRQAESQERELLKNLAPEEDTSQSAVAAPLSETISPRAPRILMRCSTSTTIEILPFRPSTAAARRRPIAYYMVFAKPSGAGTDVSLNNAEYPGTGEPIYPSVLRATVSMLAPNVSYVFAVSAYDDECEIIQGIGETSKPVVTLNPLPLISCYGYLAQACYELKLLDHARKAAGYVYDSVVSKECASRPGWAANFFYRHALQREGLARYPIPILNLVVQSILVLCHDEEGDAMLDGKLLPPNGSILSPKQVAILENSKMLSVAIEVACAADDHDQIRVLCFKGYRVLLPLLHLDDADVLVFAALVTYYQALWSIPAAAWDTDTRSIAARIAFELLRIAWRHRHVADAVYRQVGTIKDRGDEQPVGDTCSQPSTEMRALLDTIALAECSLGKPLIGSGTSSRPTTAAAQATQPQASSKGAAKPPPASATTPQATPRAPEDGLTLRPLSVLLTQSKFSVREAFKLLEPHIKTSRESIEAFCKLCHCALDSGEEAPVEEWMSLVKVSGKIGTEFKSTLQEIGLGHLLPETTEVAAVASPPTSAPNTARSTAKTPRIPDAVAVAVVGENVSSPRAPEPEVGEDDDYLSMWCGEICLIQATILYRKLAKARAAVHDGIDFSHGPQEDCAFEILREAAPVASPSTEVVEDLPMDDARNQEFDQFMARIASSCRLFAQTRAWQALQTAAQYATNAIWLAWIAPTKMGASSLTHLITCGDAVLDMIEVVTATIKEEESGMTSTTLLSATQSSGSSASASASKTISLASTTVVVSAMSSVNADQQWIANLISFTLQALLAAKKWHKIVQVGKKYHLLSGGNSRFSEKMLPLLVYAQQQLVAEQNNILDTAQASLAAFVKSFMDAEAKKKKKKSRLVVEEVLTPAEIEFHAKKGELDAETRALTVERNERQRELEALTQMQDTVARTTNKCVQALDVCHELVEKYRRGGDNAVKIQQIVAAYSHCVNLGRQKRQRRLVGKALQELGDVLWARAENKTAVKYWNEAIDNAFNALRVTTCWRDVISVDHEKDEAEKGDPLIDGDGLWTCLEGCMAITKLILLDDASSTGGVSKVELARMAAAVVTRILTKCSLPHPSRPFLYGTYQVVSQLWPERELLVDSERLEATQFGCIFVVVIPVLLQYEHAVEAMPLIAAYEHVASQCFHDPDHIANARRMRVDALSQCGRFHDAFQVLAAIVLGVSTGKDHKPRPWNPLFETLDFHDGKPVKDPSNSAVLAWLDAIDIPKLFEDLLLLECKPDTARLVLLSVLRLIVCIADREPIEEEATSTARQIANKVATATLSLLLQAQLPVECEATNTLTTTPWDTLALQHVQAEVILQQSIVAYSGGQWAAAQKLSMQAIEVACSCKTTVDSSMGPLRSTSLLSLDTRVPSVLVHTPSTLSVRARLVIVKCDLAQRAHLNALEQIGVAIDEAHKAGEQLHYVRQLELLRAQTFVSLGSRETAMRDLVELRGAFVASHTVASPEYVDLLRVSASLLRDKAMESKDESSFFELEKAMELLEEGEAALDAALRQDGWIGVDVDASQDERLNLYHPCLPMFVQLNTELTQILMEMPVACSDDAAETRRTRALLLIDVALKAVDHTAKPLVPTKARLLVLKGAILKKTLMTPRPLGCDETMVIECVSSLLSAIQEATRVDGGHDRELLRLAFMELVDLYSAKLVSGQEAEHVQAAFHYLNLALTIQSHQQILFDSLELQSGTLTNADKLPSFIVDAIVQQQGELLASVKVPPPPQAAAPTGKGAAAAIVDQSKRSGVDAQRLVNYFLKILREKQVLPACTGLQQQVAVVLHTFLLQNHSTYGKLCCLQSVPPVPHNDPEIKAGLISVHWMRDLTPALTTTTPSTGLVSMFFTLGTTRMADGTAAPTRTTEPIHDDAIVQRAERFATSPLLSKRTGIVESDVSKIRQQLSRLRIQMEDDESLVIDKTAFATSFHGILVAIQHLFRPQQTHAPQEEKHHSATGDDQDELDSSQAAENPDVEVVRDTFGVAIPVVCSLQSVKLLDALFHLDRGVHNAVENALNYFLRDLLDNEVQQNSK